MSQGSVSSVARSRGSCSPASGPSWPCPIVGLTLVPAGCWRCFAGHLCHREGRPQGTRRPSLTQCLDRGHGGQPVLPAGAGRPVPGLTARCSPAPGAETCGPRCPVPGQASPFPPTAVCHTQQDTSASGQESGQICRSQPHSATWHPQSPPGRQASRQPGHCTRKNGSQHGSLQQSFLPSMPKRGGVPACPCLGLSALKTGWSWVELPKDAESSPCSHAQELFRDRVFADVTRSG